MTTIIKYLTLVAVAALSVSCSSHDVEMPDASQPSDTGGCQAGFTITLASDDAVMSRLASRAPSPGDYENGSAAENYIDIDGEDFKILFFDSQDKYIGALEHVLVIIESNDGTMKRYRVSGTVPVSVVDNADQKFKMMMLANWRHNYPEMTEGMSLEDIASSTSSLYTFDFENDQKVGSQHPIPMFGVSNLIEGLEFTPKWNTDLGTLHMLRAYAKVRVRAGSGSLPITSVSLTRANTRGYRAPIGVTKEDDYEHGSYALDYWPIASIPAERGEVPDISFVKNDKDEWIVYVPEFINLNTTSDGKPDPKSPLSASERARIKVKFQDHVGEEYVDFKYYSKPHAYAGENVEKDDHFDILRNTVYDYTLTKYTGTADVNIEVDIQPYANQELKIDFGLMRDEQGDLMVLPEKDVNGKDSLPEYFMDYLKYHKKDTILEKFPLSSLVPGDYYAIHRGQDGELSNAEIWLKDIDGAHVLENFSQKDDNADNCSTRYVELYFGLDKYYYLKDRDGDRRLKHFTNHWSIVLDRKDYMIFKSPDNKERYEVASFDEKNPYEFHIVPDPAEDNDNYFFIKVTISEDGTKTEEKVTVPKNPTEETE